MELTNQYETLHIKRKFITKISTLLEGTVDDVKKINDLVYKIQSGPHSKPTKVRRDRLRKYVGLHFQSLLKVSAPAEHELQVEQQPEIKEVFERQPDDGVMSDVEHTLGEETLEKSLLRRSKRQTRSPERLELMSSNKNC